MCLGVPGRMREVWDTKGTQMARVDFGGVRKDVCLAYLPDLQVGDYAIVHVGFALSSVDKVGLRRRKRCDCSSSSARWRKSSAPPPRGRREVPRRVPRPGSGACAA